MEAKLIIISGRVQGVGYRFSTKQIADELGISGYAENVRDYVEILGIGEPQPLSEFVEKVTAGAAPSSKVEDYSVKDVPVDDSYDKFYTK